MKKRKGSKKFVAAATTLAAIAALSLTFAWFTSKDSATNKFEGQLAGNDVEVVETFTPPKEWEPGQEVNKDVSILNSGQYKSMIRVNFEEVLQLLLDAEAKLTNDATLLNGKTAEEMYLIPADSKVINDAAWTNSVIQPSSKTTFTVTGGAYAGTYELKAKEQVVTTAAGTNYKYVSYWDNGTNQYYAKTNGYDRQADGSLIPQTADFKVIDLATSKIDKSWTNPVYTPTIDFKADGTATIASATDPNVTLNFVNLTQTPQENKWFYNSADGKFYFVGIVDAQTQTAQLLDSVKLSQEADNKYSKFKFDLTVNAESIQANVEAVNSTQWVNQTDSNLVTALEGLY